MSKTEHDRGSATKVFGGTDPGEIEYMLRYHPTIWQEALMRGKQVRSTPDSQARTQEYFT